MRNVRQKRETNISTLAFIDVMACGLGAVILLFFILDFNEESVPQIINGPAIENNTVHLEEKYAAMLDAKNSKLNEIKRLSKKVSDSTVKLLETKLKLQDIDKTAEPELQRKDIDVANQLIGLAVTGPKIQILLDTSASMAFPQLIDILSGLEDMSGKRLASGGKWRQAKNITRWLIKKAPDSSLLKVIGFSEKITFESSSWGDSVSTLNQFNTSIKNISPKNGTNLATVLEHIQSSSSEATDIYLVTDGLPTLSGQTNPIRTIGKFIKGCRNSNSQYVSGECRETFFLEAINKFGKQSNVKVNVILLALEGDPRAAHNYLHWANSSGGILFSPASYWLK